MCSDILNNFMCVSRKTAEVYSCKAKLEGILWGAAAGMAAGVAVGLMVNSEKAQKMKDKFMCMCNDATNKISDKVAQKKNKDE